MLIFSRWTEALLVAPEPSGSTSGATNPTCLLGRAQGVWLVSARSPASSSPAVDNPGFLQASLQRQNCVDPGYASAAWSVNHRSRPDGDASGFAGHPFHSDQPGPPPRFGHHRLLRTGPANPQGVARRQPTVSRCSADPPRRKSMMMIKASETLRPPRYDSVPYKDSVTALFATPGVEKDRLS